MQTRRWDESGKALNEHKWFDDEVRCVVDAPGPCPRTRQDGKSGSEDHLPLAGVLPHPLVASRNIVDGVFRTAGVPVYKVGQDAPPVFPGPGARKGGEAPTDLGEARFLDAPESSRIHADYFGHARERVPPARGGHDVR